MTRCAQIEISFSGYWLSGTGAARGRDVDAIGHRDRDGLPAMPMTQVKGQLRETAERLEAVGAPAWPEGSVQKLFGQRSDPDAPDEGLQRAALLFRGDARLPDDLRAWLSHPQQAQHREKLFRRLSATAINEMGVATDRTLRAVEAAVPVTLHGRVEWRVGDPVAGWIEALDAACAATVAFGKLKADGYGRAVARVLALP
jgi:hypothetical protein